MNKEELKDLSDKTFFDNDEWQITPDGHRNFNNKLIDAVAMAVDIPAVPKNVSAFTNDANYLTASSFDNALKNYAQKPERNIITVNTSDLNNPPVLTTLLGNYTINLSFALGDGIIQLASNNIINPVTITTINNGSIVCHQHNQSITSEWKEIQGSSLISANSISKMEINLITDGGFCTKVTLYKTNITGANNHIITFTYFIEFINT